MANKNGMTLLELLVYMALAALVMAPVIMLMRNASVNMARDASRVNLQMSGREILNIIYDDLKNTGYKLDPINFKAHDSVSYMDTAGRRSYINACGATPAPAASSFGPCPVRFDTVTGKFDLSSFMPGNKAGGDYYDALTVRVGNLGAGGGWHGIDTVTYSVDPGAKELKRSVRGVSSPSANTVTLARNVAALKFRYSDNLTVWRDAFTNDDAGRRAKSYVQYIKAIIVTKDNKRLAPVNNLQIAVTDSLFIDAGDNALYERHEIVIPVPNNGLFP